MKYFIFNSGISRSGRSLIRVQRVTFLAAQIAVMLALAGCAPQAGTAASIGFFGSGVGKADTAVSVTFRTLGEISAEAEFSRASYGLLSGGSQEARCEKISSFSARDRKQAEALVQRLRAYLDKFDEFVGESASDRTANEVFNLAKAAAAAATSFNIAGAVVLPALEILDGLRQSIVSQLKAEAARQLVKSMQGTVDAIANGLKVRLGRVDGAINTAIVDWQECEQAILKLYMDNPELSLPQKEARIRQFHEELLSLRKRETAAVEALGIFDKLKILHKDIADPSKNLSQSIAQTRLNLEAVVAAVKGVQKLSGQD